MFPSTSSIFPWPIAFNMAYSRNGGRWLHSFVMVSSRFKINPATAVIRQFASRPTSRRGGTRQCSQLQRPPVYPCDSWPRVRENHRAGSAIPPSRRPPRRRQAERERDCVLRRRPASVITRCASTRAASTNATSFSSVSACSGVLVRVSRTTHVFCDPPRRTQHRRRRHGALPKRVQAAAYRLGRDLACNPPCRSTLHQPSG